MSVYDVGSDFADERMDSVDVVWFVACVVTIVVFAVSGCGGKDGHV